MTMKDTEVYEILQAEETRQKSILRMIPSECIMSDDVLACSGSRIAQKYRGTNKWK